MNSAHPFNLKTIFAGSVLAIALLVLPFSNKAEAQYAVTVVGDTSGPSMWQLAKESGLDGAAKAAARMIIQQMVADTINWINSGFQGSPAFVQNLDRYLLSIADQAAVGFLESEGFGFLCEPFQLDVQIAVATQYNNSTRDPGEFTPQCTLNDVSDNIEGFLTGSFSEGGGWGSWLELTQGSTNDPNKAVFEAEMALNAAIRDAEGNAITELDWGKGFLSFKVCADTDVASGAQSDCDIVTPGQTIADQLNSALNVGRDELIAADEINEIIGALLSQLARQALSAGIGALSGGGGGGSTTGGGGYTSESGDTYDSILDALNDPNSSENNYTGPGSSASNPFAFETVISSYEEYITILERIINRLEATETQYDTVAASCQTTMSLDYPTSFLSRRIDAEGQLGEARLRLAAIREVESRYQEALEARDTAERTRILEEFERSVRTGTIVSNYEITQLELYLNYDLNLQINNFNDDLRAQEFRCNPPRSGSDS
jgi:hypothetical protein